jgi:hypothetical protein
MARQKLVGSSLLKARFGHVRAGGKMVTSQRKFAVSVQGRPTVASKFRFGSQRYKRSNNGFVESSHRLIAKASMSFLLLSLCFLVRSLLDYSWHYRCIMSLHVCFTHRLYRTLTLFGDVVKHVLHSSRKVSCSLSHSERKGRCDQWVHDSLRLCSIRKHTSHFLVV